MEILSAEFVISNTKVDKCPQGNLPEYAFIGRSNVGKSSLINMLTKRPKLAMTSSTPGKTLLINHFLVNNEWYLVDLPGYGFALRGKKQVDKIQKIIEDYILGREQMTNLFVLIDCRLEPQKIDLEFMVRILPFLRRTMTLTISVRNIRRCSETSLPVETTVSSRQSI